MSSGLTKKVKEFIDKLLTTDIDGCITGSCLLDDNFDEWVSAPDIDIFTYSIAAQIHAIDVLEYVYGFKPGKYDSSKNQLEQWKVKMLRTRDHKKDMPLSTVSMYRDGLTVNVSYRKDQKKLIDVISVFDMTIIMKGIDIHTGYTLDLTGDNKRIATPNPLRNQDPTMFNAEHWVRQFDRVIKYWNRGYDTRPMAQFYINMISTVLDEGDQYTTDKSKEMYEEFVTTYSSIKDTIQEWLDEKVDI